ncbi:MAG TPA: hypothetical protein PK200_11825 [Spirochaetota bacterium]|nr:hypothetical protein [Spirochaetota bacterium]HQO03305.1 hypothetical protein [Spirochaetota bacterium]HQP47417.1 hypothetical protein [Spirochaetota bacterium]
MKMAILFSITLSAAFDLVTCGGKNIKPMGNKIVDEQTMRIMGNEGYNIPPAC